MSTHRAELEWLAIVARRKGANVSMNLDEAGRIDSMSVEGLPGMRDLKGPPLVMAEALRKAVGRAASTPSVERERMPGIHRNRYEPEQLAAYGGVRFLLRVQLARGDLSEGDGVVSVTCDPEGRDGQRYWQMQEHGPVEVRSLDVLLAAQKDRQSNGPDAPSV